MSTDFQFPTSDFAPWHMGRALELAARGRGLVEPNPMVGCVIIAKDGEVVGEGWHQRFGGPHAEVEALRIAGKRAAGATLYVNLEPCCHQGKTPPCTSAIIAAGVRRVVAAQRDPFPAVSGDGFGALRAAGIETYVGLLETEARRLNAPYLKLVEIGRPWIIVKWAMSLDGKIATRTGESRWISNEQSRRVVHELRGRVDAIVMGSTTAAVDDPLLTARPAGPRLATRVVLDSNGTLDSSSQLVRTAKEVPVLVAVGSGASAQSRERLRSAGCEVLVCKGATAGDRLAELLADLGQRRMTNVLVEGGGKVLGSLFDAKQVDEAHVFIAPILIGGDGAPGPIAGLGTTSVTDAVRLSEMLVKQLAGDLYVSGRVMYPTTPLIPFPNPLAR